MRAGRSVEALDQAPDPLAGENRAARGKKERTAARALIQLRTAFEHIFLNRLDRSAAERHQPLLISFAPYQDPLLFKREILEPESGQLRNTHAAGIKQLEN